MKRKNQGGFVTVAFMLIAMWVTGVYTVGVKDTMDSAAKDRELKLQKQDSDVRLRNCQRNCDGDVTISTSTR